MLDLEIGGSIDDVICRHLDGTSVFRRLARKPSPRRRGVPARLLGVSDSTMSAARCDGLTHLCEASAKRENKCAAISVHHLCVVFCVCRKIARCHRAARANVGKMHHRRRVWKRHDARREHCAWPPILIARGLAGVQTDIAARLVVVKYNQ